MTRRGNPEAVLDTERLRLEPLRASHAAEMFAWLSDERLYWMTGNVIGIDGGEELSA